MVARVANNENASAISISSGMSMPRASTSRMARPQGGHHAVSHRGAVDDTDHAGNYRQQEKESHAVIDHSNYRQQEKESHAVIDHNESSVIT
jgi:hypothetical protein